jgi:hypothetical protein
VDSAALRSRGILGKVVVRPTSEYENLEIAGLFGKQSAEPVHAVFVALNELRYDFGDVRVATLALLTLTTLSR